MPSKGEIKVVDRSKDGNRLLDSISSKQRLAVLALCELVELETGTILCEAGDCFSYAYFPVIGNISLVKILVGHEPFEAESIGSEGMLGTALILGVNRVSLRGVVVTPCLALRMSAKSLVLATQSSPEFFRVLQRYLYVVLAELLQTTACIRFHDVSKRLARLLLMTHDRAQGDHLFLTHLLLADALGVQRGAVTIAAMKLQRRGIIRYSRGKISILDRKKLEQASCECYSATKENYASILS